MNSTIYLRRAHIHRGFFVGMRGPRIAAGSELSGAKRLAAQLSRHGGIFGVVAPLKHDPERRGVVAWFAKGEPY